MPFTAGKHSSKKPTCCTYPRHKRRNANDCAIIILKNDVLVHHREHSRLRCARRELTSCIRTRAEEYIRKRKHSQHPHEREGKKRETSFCAACYGVSQQTYSLFSSEVCVPLGREGRRGRKRRTAACTAVYVTSFRLSPDRKQYDRREQPQRGPVDPPANRITEAVFCELPRH